MAFITVLQNTENSRAGGEFKGLILLVASTVWYGVFAAGFHFCDMYFFAIFKTDHAKLVRINTQQKKIPEFRCPQLYNSGL